METELRAEEKQYRELFENTLIAARRLAEKDREEALGQLRERIKELTLLHYAGELLNTHELLLPELLQAIVELLPVAWQYSEIAVARIQYGDLELATSDFQVSPWLQRAEFSVPGGHEGVIEIYYREERPPAGEGPFLAEERTTLDALCAMLQAELERRRAAVALQRAEARYRTLFETMAQGVIYQDETGSIIDINPAAERILGIAGADILKEEITNNDVNLVRENGSPFPRDERPGRVAIRTGRPVYGQVMGIAVPGEDGYRWMVVNSIPQFHPGEETPYQVYSTLEDITDRKRIEERRANLAALVESSQDAVVGVDLKGAINFWNRGAQNMYGWSAQEVIGQHSRILYPQGHENEQFTIIEKIRRGEIVENQSTVRLTKGGKRIFVSLSVAPVLDGTGRLMGISGIARDITKEKRAEARLRFQAQLLASVNESVVACDLQERIVYWSEGATALYGYSREEAIGQPLAALNLIPSQQTREARQQQMKQIHETGSWSGEVLQKRKDGSRFWARISLSLVRDRQGRPVGFIGIDRDVTEQRQRERELEAIALVTDVLRSAQSPLEINQVIFEQLSSLVNVNHGAILLLDPEKDRLTVTHVHGGYSEYLSTIFDREPSISSGVVRSRQPFTVAKLQQLSKKYRGPTALADSALACLPLVSSGAVIGVLWLLRAEPFTHSDVRILTAVSDMMASTLQRALYFHKLEEQAVQVQRIIDTVEDGLLLLDRDLRVVLANPAAIEHMVALEARDGGSDMAHTLIGERIERLGTRPLQSILQEAAGAEQSLTTLTAPRREFRTAAHAVVEDGQNSGWVLVLRDVTEERRMQVTVEQQERLAAVGQLAAGIAHDFNNVMSAIVLYSQILQRRADLSEKERHRLDIIYRQANHAISLIRQILDFSRRSVMERSAMDLVPFFKEMFKLFERTLPETITLSLNYEEPEFIVLADPTRLQQAVTNLAINARDAMPEGGEFGVHLARLTLERWQMSQMSPVPDMEAGNWLQITVADDGAGMSEAMVQHAFEPFYTTKAPGKGTGLGLAQVYGIIRQHDGFITVESTVGQGSTFSIYLPLLESSQTAQEAPVPTLSQATAAEREATILVVEDEEWARIAVEESLQALGYDVLSARDGQAALELFTSQREGIDLVLSDMVMPGMGGLQLYEQMHVHYPDVKMIIMSGYPLEDGGHSLLEQGVVAWIAKPFSVNDLAEKVAELLR